MSKLKNQETEKLQQQFDAFDNQVKEMTLDNMNQAPKLDVEPQTKLSQVELQKSKDVYLKPKRAIASREKFDEKWRERYNFDREYVNFIAENKEIIGESIDLWTKPYPGMPAEEWDVPVNKPVWGPRYLAEQIKRKNYHRLSMDTKPVDGSSSGYGTMFGNMVVNNTIQRLDAYPVSPRKSIFMGANNF